MARDILTIITRKTTIYLFDVEEKEAMDDVAKYIEEILMLVKR